MVTTNRSRERYLAGEVVLGTYVTLPTATAAEIAAVAGFDFVRIDAYHVAIDHPTLHNMVRAIRAHPPVTPWVRVRNDPWEIKSVLDMGVEILTIPNVDSPDAARRAVDAAFYAPLGAREMSHPVRLRAISSEAALAWTADNVVISCQIEGAEGIAAYREIVKVEGVEIIQTGRGDIALGLGMPGNEYHPSVLAIERQIIEAALEAGKQANVMVPLTNEGLDYAQSWIERGVRLITLDSDYKVLARAYELGLGALRSSKPDSSQSTKRSMPPLNVAD